MPKTLILFTNEPGPIAGLAETVAAGARSVRFSEVTVRCIRDVASIEDLAAYDGIVICSTSQDGSAPDEVTHLLRHMVQQGAGDEFSNKVGSALVLSAPDVGGDAPAAWSAMATMAQLGMILIAARSADGTPGAAEHLGKRVAEVVGWITHARSHAHSPAHTHAPAPSHSH